MAVIKDLGAVTAYAAAVEGGYTGTKAEFETLMASYATVAEEAAESAESASTSATSASASAQTATTKASEASTSATQASASATSASQSAQIATTKASEASASASTASTKASEASTSASTASSKASEASASATSAQTAQGLAESARDDAIDAKTDAESARDLAQQYADSIDPEKIYSAYPTDTASGDVASFADGADDIPLKSCVVALEPVQSGSGDPSPTNVRPISGWTGANVVRTGINIWDEEWERGWFDWTTGQEVGSYAYIRFKNLVSVKPATQYVFVKPSGILAMPVYYDADGVFVSCPDVIYTANPYTVLTIPDNVYYVRFAIKETSYSNDVSLNYPSTDHDYHPYAGNTYSITLPTEAGTVYGGVLDVTNGVLTVDRVFATKKWGQMSDVYSGTTHSTKSLNFDANVLTGGQNSITNITATYTEKTTEQSTHYYVSSNMKGVYVTLPNDTNADTDIQVCGTLKEPIVYTLSPTEIKSLLGDNNVWADAGDTTVTYRADTAKYIDKKIAEVINALS